MRKFSDKINEDVTDFGSRDRFGQRGTRVLFVKGTSDNPDFAASEFEMIYRGTNVTDIINNPKDFIDPKFSEAEWELEVLEFGPVDKEFIKFLYSSDMFDYEQTKDRNIYFDGDILK